MTLLAANSTRWDVPLRAHTHKCAVAGRRGGGGGRSSKQRRPPPEPRRQQKDREEDVEIFSLDGGWNMEALAGMGLEDLGSANAGASGASGWEVVGGGDWETSSPDSGWSVESVVGTGGDGAWELETGDDDEEDWGEDEGMEEYAQQEAAAAAPEPRSAEASAPASARKRRPPGGALAAEALLASVPRHLLRKLEVQQAEAAAEAARLRPAERKKAAARLRMHQRLRVIAGSAAGTRLRSPQGDQTRPMMEMVRGAVFNMLLSLSGASAAGGTLPPASRWLDLFAGTGAVGIEALSRGAEECHFVELSPWVVSNCLRPNLESCGLDDLAVVHSGRAEDFLRSAAAAAARGGRPQAGGAFDFLSVCPPYELVDYEELYELLDNSPLLHEESLVVVEYPKKLARLIRERLGPLAKLRDRRYGRTFIAVYGPAEFDPDVAAVLAAADAAAGEGQED